ncbi:LOW QUALITY PROTEIN: FACT complex subunit SPT16-like [Olea europaea var. sylvestris]|uniref:LOW QUALITY PROTEIN: FACT complex subunit SPT16-like n=1 Tax=Olea europaea var. sylvestris TaxID=158386 RepID=UPI000C1D32E8|nr:LOW QUALITY PROTEIN: FACT complex subunit SPT16-like [Olea europaea var. sylvestris]
MAEKHSANGPPANGKSVGGNAYTIDLTTFSQRLQALYTHWRQHKDELWGSADALAIATPPPSEDLRYLKSSALNIWLLGYEFPETIMVFGDKHIHFLCSQKKATLLEVVKRSAKEAVGADVVMHIKSKSDDGSILMDAVFHALRSQLKPDGSSAPIVGHIAREAPEGKLLEMWDDKVKNSGLQLSDMTNGLSDLFSVKDKNEITCVKKAAYLSACAMKNFVVPKVEKVIDEEKKVTHSSLMDDTEKAILDPVKIGVKLKAENVDICYPPIFQSGGTFDLRPSASSNDEYLYYDSASVIICAIGSRYNSYCSNIARTYLIDANTAQSRAYEVLLKAHEAAIIALKPGNRVSAVYQAVLAVVERDAPELVPNLTKSAGTGIGLEFRESGLSLNAKNDRVLKAGMIFNVSIGFQNLQAGTINPKSQNFSLLLADTVIVTNEETARRLAGEGSGSGEGRSTVRSTSELVAYKNVNELPPPRDMMIQVDQKNEAILLPIYGSMVPFHVATVKTVSSQQDTNRNCYIRIIFNVPGTPFTPHDTNSLKNQGAIYLKEVSFRSKDPRHISEVVQLIKTLRRNVMARESERAERATLVTQEKLVLAGNKFKPIKLYDLWIRPPFGGRGRKLPGTLEAHVNGFRYSTSRPDERVDIMYGNIKHAFFQPADKEMITLLHFHLHNHIMIGNKKVKDAQFYVEVMEAVQTIGGGKRSAYDPDEIEEEQRERDRKNKINVDFQNFVNRVNDLWGQAQFKGLDLEFDQPLRELGFHGVPYKASAFIVPTSSCLVELIETPFLVITLSEIEIVNLERVGLGQKNFDMAIVFKDFKRDVMRIDSIPSSSLDGIKEWLDTTDIKYYESRLNLNWRPILKTITDDPQKFLEDGGWEFLNLEATDSDSDNSVDSDQGYEPSDAEPVSESEDDDSDSESLVESEDEEEEDSEEDSEEEKGKTWDELEREASNADKERDESDSEDERRRRKAKAFGKSRAAPNIAAASKRMKFR